MTALSTPPDARRAVAVLAFVAMSTFHTAHAERKTMTTNQQPELRVIHPQSEPSNPGPEAWFTGSVRVTPLCDGEAPSCLHCASVAFSPGARTAWHSHPRGQLLVVTEGSGLVQEWGKPVRRIQKGDVVWTPPGVKHWHGATAATAMTHTAVQEDQNGKVVEWMEKVADAEYAAPAQ